MCVCVYERGCKAKRVEGKDGVQKRCVIKIPCGKVAEKLCVCVRVKEGVGQRGCAEKMVCNKDVYERLCVTKLGVTKMCTEDGV